MLLRGYSRPFALRTEGMADGTHRRLMAKTLRFPFIREGRVFTGGVQHLQPPPITPGHISGGNGSGESFYVPPRALEDRALQSLRLRGPDQARQDQPRHLLAQRRLPRRIGQPHRPRRDHPRHHERPPSRPGAVRHHRRGLEGMTTYGDAAVS